ncbi:MAG: hypothetical protein JNG84_15100 [Archangium sp.]|nr:hypothetical protein [Archangium sp.]
MSTWGVTVPHHSEVVLSDGRTVIGDIHLQPSAIAYSGPESPGDLFNRRDPFFAMTVEGGGALLVAKAQVLFAKVQPLAASEPLALGDAAEVSSTHRELTLEVTFDTGSTFVGTLSAELSPERSRAIDFLNGAPRFFALRSGENVVLINTHRIATVRPP